LVPVRKQPELKEAGAFSPALLVLVATTGTNGLYKPGLKAFFPPVATWPAVDAHVVSPPPSRSPSDLTLEACAPIGVRRHRLNPCPHEGISPTHFGSKSRLIWFVWIVAWTSKGCCPPPVTVWVLPALSGPTHFLIRSLHRRSPNACVSRHFGLRARINKKCDFIRILLYITKPNTI
jgi:hypothetical protein